MENSQPNKRRTEIKEFFISNIISKIFILISPILLFIGVFLWNVTSSFFMTYPFLGGVLLSWFVAISSTFIVLFCAYINSDKKKEYYEIFKQSEWGLRAITVCILIYLAIHLASKAFWDIGIPRFGETYAELGFISPQDVFLLSFVFFLIISIYFIAPSYILKYKRTTLPILFLISFVLSILFAWKFTYFISHAASLIYSYYPSFAPFKSTAEQSQTAISSLPFVVVFVVVSIIYLILQSWETMKLPEGSKREFQDLQLVFCIIPAIIVASLVSAGNELVRFPNIPGHVVVGLLFIGGFATYMSMMTISFKQESPPFPFFNPIWVRSTIDSLIAVSLFSLFFLSIRDLLKIDVEIFGKALNFSVAIMLLILLYGFLYEKLQKYHFTEWWRREYKPIALITSILLISIVSVIYPQYIYKKGICIFLVLVVIFCLPWILMSMRKIEIKRWKELPEYLKKIIKGKIKIRPMNQGIVLIKVETAPGSLENVVKELDKEEGLYQTMMVKGSYDLCTVVEGVDFDDIERKISKIRKAKGVASTTTLMDIREIFDREVR